MFGRDRVVTKLHVTCYKCSLCYINICYICLFLEGSLENNGYLCHVDLPFFDLKLLSV